MQKILVATNLWVGLAVALFTCLSFPIWLSTQSVTYTFLVGFATVGGYGYMRWVQVFQKSSAQQTTAYQWFIQYRGAATFTMTFSLSCGLLLLYNYFSLESLIWLLPAALLVFLYPITFKLPFHSFTSLRSLPGIKLLLISFSWTYLTFVIPQLLLNSALNTVFFGEVLFRTLFIAAITLPFDMRDAEVDATQMHTLPQLIGTKKALDLARFGLVCYQFWIIFQAIAGHKNWLSALFWCLGLEVGLYILKGVKRYPTEKYISFWVEAIPIILALLVILGETLATNFTFKTLTIF
jgi:hypothetical protein